jgi:hypothetical protein
LSCASFSAQISQNCEKINAYGQTLLKNVLRKNSYPDLRSCNYREFLECFYFGNANSSKYCPYGITGSNKIETIENIENLKINNLSTAAINYNTENPLKYKKNEYDYHVEIKPTLDETVYEIYKKFNNLEEIKFFYLLHPSHKKLPKLEALLKEHFSEVAAIESKNAEDLIRLLDLENECAWYKLSLVIIFYEKPYYFNCGSINN